MVKGGAIRAIAHTGIGRLTWLPDLPPVADTLPGYECYEWNGIFAPAATPRPIIDKLNAGLNAVIGEPDIAKRLAELNAETRPNTPEEARAFVNTEIATRTAVVRAGSTKIDT